MDFDSLINKCSNTIDEVITQKYMNKIKTFYDIINKEVTDGKIYGYTIPVLNILKRNYNFIINKKLTFDDEEEIDEDFRYIEACFKSN